MNDMSVAPSMQNIENQGKNHRFWKVEHIFDSLRKKEKRCFRNTHFLELSHCVKVFIWLVLTFRFFSYSMICAFTDNSYILYLKIIVENRRQIEGSSVYRYFRSALNPSTRTSLKLSIFRWWLSQWHSYHISNFYIIPYNMKYYLQQLPDMMYGISRKIEISM